MMLAGGTIGFGLALFVTAIALLLETRTQVVAIWALSVFFVAGALGWFAEILFGPAIRSIQDGEPDPEEEAAELSRRFPGAAAVISEEALRGRAVDVTFPAELDEQGDASPSNGGLGQEQGGIASVGPESSVGTTNAPPAVETPAR